MEITAGELTVGLPWVRLDSTVMQNPKILLLVEDKKWRAVVVWVASLAHSGAQGSDGYIQKACLPLLHGTPADARALVSVGLWHDAPGGGWQINDWAEYQPVTEQMQRRSQRARDAALIRWERARSNGHV